jgi:hypothetical protein
MPTDDELENSPAPGEEDVKEADFMSKYEAERDETIDDKEDDTNEQPAEPS